VRKLFQRASQSYVRSHLSHKCSGVQFLLIMMAQ
jgi:hypothetical protein